MTWMLSGLKNVPVPTWPLPLVTLARSNLSSSSKRWVARQKKDKFAKMAKAESYRARSSYKLIALDDKYRFIRQGGKAQPGWVIDCGSAPGGWSQVVMERLKNQRPEGEQSVIGIDLLPMLPIDGVNFIQGDFTTEKIKREIEAIIGDRRVRLVLSDMAPSFSGHHNTDHLRSMASRCYHQLCEDLVNFSDTFLCKGGALACKYIMGGDEKELKEMLESRFEKVHNEKPESSRKQSSERFFVCLGKVSDPTY
ncbi:2' O-ribose methyltransferase [Mycoemilia scoparia]|uniref:rRNA methyltransferase 2, mitochondrial n=1 Tax=Mycoemilia scoparia TaxID=417184 RepID=A0A9W8A8J3_9FUNG|nr:2' O-ribose methyltransferase [Mycoemilia scoparia]